MLLMQTTLPLVVKHKVPTAVVAVRVVCDEPGLVAARGHCDLRLNISYGICYSYSYRSMAPNRRIAFGCCTKVCLRWRRTLSKAVFTTRQDEFKLRSGRMCGACVESSGAPICAWRIARVI